MTLKDRIDATEWSDVEQEGYANLVARGRDEPGSHDIIMAAAATLLGDDGADIFELSRRSREIVDLALAIQAERVRPPTVRPVRLTIVGGRDA